MMFLGVQSCTRILVWSQFTQWLYFTKKIILKFQYVILDEYQNSISHQNPYGKHKYKILTSIN